MEENKLTAREIFTQITILQKDLTENSQTSLHRLGDTISTLESEGVEATYEQVSEICDVFKTRELTLLKMLEMYEKMYEDVQSAETRRVNLIKSAVDAKWELIRDAEMDLDAKFEAIDNITVQMAELVERVMFKE